MSIYKKRLFLLDMDGTIYLGNRLFDHSLMFLSKIKQMGASYIFFTNNSSKSLENYVSKLNAMGIDAGCNQIISSSSVTISYLIKKYGKKPIYAMGTAAFCSELTKNGLNIVNNTDAQISAFVMGFDTELNFSKLEDACILLGRGIDYIATNCDLLCPTEYGYVPDCGSIAQILKNATGREPVFMGKPAPHMVDLALERMKCSKEDAVLIGDRMYTDIACGNAAGIDTALVLSGESKREDLEMSLYKPTYVFEDVGEIFANRGILI